MAGIFNIFNESENRFSVSARKDKENSHTVALSRLKSVGSLENTPAKLSAQPHIKPKGLSIRSKSDLNVHSASNLGPSKLASKDCLKIQSKQCMPNKQSVSPLKMKTPKNKFTANITTKKLSPKISSPIMQNVVDDFVFRKPVIPKESKKLTYPEPENLAYQFDQYNYMTEEMQNIFDEERMLLRSARKNDYSETSLEDEGFISDSEIDSFEFELSSLLSPLPPINNIELPEISDCED